MSASLPFRIIQSWFSLILLIFSFFYLIPLSFIPLRLEDKKKEAVS